MTLKTLNRLEKIARKNIDPQKQGRCRHIAFAILRNRIVEFETNSVKKTCTYHSLNGFKYPFCHAETSVIKKCIDSGYNLKKMRLVVLRIGGEHDGLMNSKPCSKCQKVIKMAGFKEVIYSTYNDYKKL